LRLSSEKNAPDCHCDTQNVRISTGTNYNLYIPIDNTKKGDDKGGKNIKGLKAGRKASEILAKEAEKHIGALAYTSEAIRARYRFHKGLIQRKDKDSCVNVGETHQPEIVHGEQLPIPEAEDLSAEHFRTNLRDRFFKVLSRVLLPYSAFVGNLLDGVLWGWFWRFLEVRSRERTKGGGSGASSSIGATKYRFPRESV
jgi:hypothetical protein